MPDSNSSSENRSTISRESKLILGLIHRDYLMSLLNGSESDFRALYNPVSRILNRRMKGVFVSLAQFALSVSMTFPTKQYIMRRTQLHSGIQAKIGSRIMWNGKHNRANAASLATHRRGSPVK